MVGTYVLEIEKVIDETPEVKTYRLRIPEGSGLAYTTGQFFMLKVFGPDGAIIEETRAYSISSSPADEGFIEFTIQLVGSFTHKIWERKAGDKVELKGPFGHFTFTDEMKEPVVMVGAGSGVTPLRAILTYVAKKNLTNRVDLLYSCRKPDLIIFEKEFHKIMEKHPNIKVHFTITRLAEGEKWDGETGRWDKERIQKKVGDCIKDARCYLCGPVAFVQSMKKDLLELGAKQELIKQEQWG